MPTVSVRRDLLFDALGKTYEDAEFEDLCFRYGIELDDITTERAVIRRERHLDEEEPAEGEEIIYKIEVPANRYDLLCIEGLAQALHIFEEREEIPTYAVANISLEHMLKMHVKQETSMIRPYVICAVLRGVVLNEARYKSFIYLQDKLHQNICRERTLVAIGTHDLDTIQAPFSYEALQPSEISFVPLKQTRTFCASELMEFYRTDSTLNKFLHIIENSPVYPVIYDSNRTVLSLPPIINGAHSAITLNTKNVFIECTATDLTKAKIVLNTLVAMFSRYCERKFEVEPVEVVNSDGKSYIYPDLSLYNMEVPLSYINDTIGISLKADEVTRLLKRMQLHAKKSITTDNKYNISVSVPPTRSDILHPCDVMEDVAIAFSYNEIPKRKAASLNSLPLNELASLKSLPLEELSDLIRLEIAMSGFTEVLTFQLCSYKDNFAMLNREDDKSNAVIVANPRSTDCESLRTTLMSGILKTVAHNKDHPNPIKIFEVGDVTVLDHKTDVGATKHRHLAALYCDSRSGFEIIHGLLDKIMEKIRDPLVDDNSNYYYITSTGSDAPEFLPGMQASVFYKGKKIGGFGTVHPLVLKNFDISEPCSYLELNVESFL